MCRVGAERVAPECSPAVEVAVEQLVSKGAPDLGSDFPSHTCIADRQCRIASGPHTRPRRPGQLPQQSHQPDRTPHQLRHRHLGCQKPRQSPHLALPQ